MDEKVLNINILKIMNRHCFLLSAVCVASLLLLTSCFGSKKIFSVTSGSENLQALTKITESENAVTSVGGDYKSRTIVLAISAVEKVSSGKNNYIVPSNIYKKENPLSPSMTQLTSGDNINAQPAYNSETDRVAFYRYMKGGGSTDIYMMPATKGTALIPVTDTGSVDEYCPSFSADGKLLAYGKGRTFIDSEVWLRNLQTGENMMLGSGSAPSISPDGKKIAYFKCTASDASSIWVMNIDGSNAMQLTSSKKEAAIFPKWSPDGEYIVFSSYIKDKKKDSDIYVMKKDGSDLRQLTTNESYDGHPFWSADGYIYFISDRGSKSGATQVWRFQYP